MGEGDLGTRYPSSNPAFKDLSSVLMLENIVETLKENQFRLVNLDTVICAQAPKLAPYMMAMQKSLASVLQVDSQQVNIKVKSGEGIGMIGRAEGNRRYGDLLDSILEYLKECEGTLLLPCEIRRWMNAEGDPNCSRSPGRF